MQIFQGDDTDALKNVLVGEFRVEGLARTPVLVGEFRVEGLARTPELNEVLCRMSLDLDGILRVTATEKRTGKSKHITISNALKPKDSQELAAAQERLRQVHAAQLTLDVEQSFAETYDRQWDQGDMDVVDGQIVDPGRLEPVEDPEPEQEAQIHDGVAGAEADPSSEGPELDPQWARAAHEARQLLKRSRMCFDKVHDEDKEEMLDLHGEIEEAIRDQDDQALSAAGDKLRELLFFIEGE